MTAIQKFCLNINGPWRPTATAHNFSAHLLVPLKILNELTNFDHLQEVRKCMLS